MMNIRLALIAALVWLCVSCNSEETAVLTNTTNLPTASYTQYGVFALRRNSGTVFDAHSTFEGAFANFVELDAQFSADELLGYHRLAPDTCITFQQPGDVIVNAGLIPVYNPLPSVDVTYISAGEILNLTSSSGTWLDVNRGPAPYYEYANVDPISEPMPALLKLSFPGDDFPEYGDIPIPEVTDMILSTPKAGAILSLDTEFTWTAGTLENAYIRITAEKLIGSERFHFDCMAVDDGEFQLPLATQMELGELFKDYSVKVNRTVYSMHTNGNAILLLFHSVGVD